MTKENKKILVTIKETGKQVIRELYSRYSFKKRIYNYFIKHEGKEYSLTYDNIKTNSISI